MEISKYEEQTIQNEMASTPETDQQSIEQAGAKKPGLRQKRLLKRQDAVDLSDKSDSSESGADDDSADGWEEFGNSDDEHFKNDTNKWESNLITESVPKKRGTMSTTRKLTRQNMVDIDLVFKHKTSMIEIQPITEFTKDKKPELMAGKKSSLTYRKRGKS